MSSDTALTSAYVSPVALGPVVKPLPPDKHTDSGSNLLPLLTFLFVNDVVDGRLEFDVCACMFCFIFVSRLIL